MANVKITELPQVSTVLGTDIVPTVASSATSKITITDFANSLPQVSSSLSASYLSGSSAIITNLTSSNAAIINSLSIGGALVTGSYTNNIAIGTRALESVTSSGFPIFSALNVAIGFTSQNKNTTGTRNTAVGGLSLVNNTIGSYNVALGVGSINAPSDGDYNIGIGFVAGSSFRTGSRNIFLGASPSPANPGIVTGSFNVLIGTGISGLPANTSNNIILADGQGNIKYRWDTTQNNLYGNTAITGSLFVTGSIISTQGFTGSLSGTASYATNIYNSDGELTSNRIIGSGSGYKLTLNPELIFNAPISGINSKYYIDNQINLATGTSLGTRATSSISSSMITFADVVNSNGSQTYHSAFNNINLSAAVGSTATTLYGNTIQANIAGNETSSRITAVGSSIRVARYGFSGSNDFSENINNQIYGSIISVNQYGGINSNPNCYTGTITGLLLAGSVSTGRVGNYYGIDIRPLFTPNNSTTSSAITNYYGIRLQATLGSIVPTSSIDNYYAVHIDNPTVRNNSRISNLYGLYAPSSTMKHHISGTLSIGTIETGSYQLQVVGNTGISGSLTVTGSVQISNILTLPPQDPLPIGVPTGSFAVSGSGIDCKPYFWNGSSWTSLI